VDRPLTQVSSSDRSFTASSRDLSHALEAVGDRGRGSTNVQASVAWASLSPNQLAETLLQLSQVLCALGMVLDAEQALLRALAIVRDVYGPFHRLIAAILREMSIVYYRSGMHREGDAINARVVHVLEVRAEESQTQAWCDSEEMRACLENTRGSRSFRKFSSPVSSPHIHRQSLDGQVEDLSAQMISLAQHMTFRKKQFTKRDATAEHIKRLKQIPKRMCWARIWITIFALVLMTCATTAALLIPYFKWNWHFSSGCIYVVLCMLIGIFSCTAFGIFNGIFKILHLPVSEYHFMLKIQHYLIFPEKLLMETVVLQILFGMVIVTLSLSIGFKPEFSDGAVEIVDIGDEDHHAAVPLCVGFSLILLLRLSFFLIFRGTDFFRKRYVLLMCVCASFFLVMCIIWGFVEQQWEFLAVFVLALIATIISLPVVLQKRMHASHFVISWSPDGGGSV